MENTSFRQICTRGKWNSRKCKKKYWLMKWNEEIAHFSPTAKVQKWVGRLIRFLVLGETFIVKPRALLFLPVPTNLSVTVAVSRYYPRLYPLLISHNGKNIAAMSAIIIVPLSAWAVWLFSQLQQLPTLASWPRPIANLIVTHLYSCYFCFARFFFRKSFLCSNYQPVDYL